MMKPLLNFAISVLLCSGSFSLSQAKTQSAEIQIRVLNARSGEPLRRREITVFGTNSTAGGLKTTEIIFTLHARTDATGVASFHLEGSLPLILSLYSAQADLCVLGGRVVTETIVKTGLVVEDSCARGEKYHWWEMK